MFIRVNPYASNRFVHAFFLHYARVHLLADVHVFVCLCAAELAGQWTMAGHLWEVNEWITGRPGWMLDSSHPRNAEEGKCLPGIDWYVHTHTRTQARKHTHIHTHTPKITVAYICTVCVSHRCEATDHLILPLWVSNWFTFMRSNSAVQKSALSP